MRAASTKLSRKPTRPRTKPKAMEQLKRYAEIGGRNPDSLRQLADPEEEAGDKKAAVATLEKINYIYLRDEKAHQKLADLDMELGNPTEAIREYDAVLALKPVDPAGRTTAGEGVSGGAQEQRCDGRSAIIARNSAGPPRRPKVIAGIK